MTKSLRPALLLIAALTLATLACGKSTLQRLTVLVATPAPTPTPREHPPEEPGWVVETKVARRKTVEAENPRPTSSPTRRSAPAGVPT